LRYRRISDRPARTANQKTERSAAVSLRPSLQFWAVLSNREGIHRKLSRLVAKSELKTIGHEGSQHQLNLLSIQQDSSHRFRDDVVFVRVDPTWPSQNLAGMKVVGP
jgi:hypothetical protein